MKIVTILLTTICTTPLLQPKLANFNPSEQQVPAIICLPIRFKQQLSQLGHCSELPTPKRPLPCRILRHHSLEMQWPDKLVGEASTIPLRFCTVACTNENFYLLNLRLCQTRPSSSFHILQQAAHTHTHALFLSNTSSAHYTEKMCEKIGEKCGFLQGN